MRHITNEIEAHLRTPMPTVVDEPYAIKLFNIGYESDKMTKTRKETTNLHPNHENGQDAQVVVFTLLATT
ncbi:hypothetical protein F442_23022 [Phytophthora nicotianae P10297]|uniref:Uncharacterized protein n=1 Tax=Phytophthora nicotianae P10297 TaxID=1317064 RepID=W2XZ99_PHYNI|nr:hypothetical protein F442_23022 [Phytophthora nicotianae P10297]